MFSLGLLKLFAPLAAVALLLGGVGYAVSRHADMRCEKRFVEFQKAMNEAIAERDAALEQERTRVAELRNRPAKVKKVVEKIYVQADAECSSLPSDWRLLWNADSGREETKSSGSVGDGAGVPVAATGGGG